MPELPEVETIRRGLAEVLPGKRIIKFDVRLPKMFVPGGPAALQAVIGATVMDINRRGKLLMISLSTEETLLIHLKMTGQLIYREAGQIKLAGGHPTKDIAIGEFPVKVTHAIFTFDNGSELFFNDQRQFGYIKLVANQDLGLVALLQGYGPEPLGPDFTLEYFSAGLARRAGANLKSLLLDQTFIAGLGNIYVNEALNLAKIHPLRPAGSLRPAQRKALHEAIKEVLQLALMYGGTSDNTYVTIRGEKGDYLNHARTYHRTGQPCLACGTLIRRITVGGRGTFYCPKCQRPYRIRDMGKAKVRVSK